MLRKTSVTTVAVAAAMLVPACSGGDTPSGDTAEAPDDPAEVSGDLTVLTNRTDLLQDGTLDAYAKEFTSVYPDVTVEFEAMTDYEGEVQVRLNTEEYGDVLLIPNGLARKNYATFFAPLGEEAELSDEYRFIPHGSVDGTTYGLATFGNANGFVYNTEVWEAAGVTDWPTTPEEFLSDLESIEQETNATPYYTNYHDGWPLTQWQGAVGAVSCDSEANNALAQTADPWSEGQELRAIDSLIYDIVEQGYAEEDPATTNWEQSKGLLANGKIATMFLGSWAISQMQAAAEAAGKDPSVIGYLPFPTQVDGEYCAVVAPDYRQAVSVHSEHPEAARAWIDWFTNESGFAQDQGAVPTPKDAELPETLAPFEEEGVQLLELNQDDATLVDTIDKESEVGLLAPEYRQRIVDAAHGTSGEDLTAIFEDLNSKWEQAQQSAGG